MKEAIAAVIPDVPAEVEIQLARQEYIVGKVLDNIPDDDDDDLLDKQSIRIPDFAVKYVNKQCVFGVRGCSCVLDLSFFQIYR